MTAPHVETLERLCVAAAEKDDCPEVVLALTAAIALMRGQSWQPIETAPKDGSYILASDGEQDGCAVVHWDCDGWVYAWHQYDGPMQMYSATHWQPLPTPPKDTADEQ